MPGDTPKNNDSLVLRVRFGRRSFLLSGDVERQIEREMLDAGELHAHRRAEGGASRQPHLQHGRIPGRRAPAFAVISAGFENSYGHPHPTVIERLREHHAGILRTDLDGLITIRTDGRHLSVESYAPLR